MNIEAEIIAQFRSVFGLIDITVEPSNRLEASIRGRYLVNVLGLKYHVFVYNNTMIRMWNSHEWAKITAENVTEYNSAWTPK